MSLRLSVIGTGYLGAVHAAAMAELGHTVVALDVDETKIAELAAGRAPFYEPGLPELLTSALASGRLTFTTDYALASDADVHFVCVGTPQRPGENAADMRYVDSSFEELARHLQGPTLVVGKSTVPVGTASRLEQMLRSKAPGGDQVSLAWNPEFLREGFAVKDTLHPDRLVYGVHPGERGARAKALLDQVYAATIADGTPVVVTDYATAELVKVSANSFLATKISFINAMSEVCEAAGADVVALAEAIGHDDRIGAKFLGAGIGFGGGCLPKDIRAFMARAGELGADQALTFLREVDAINMRRRSRMVDLAREQCDDSFIGKRVAVLGAAFKPDSDDVRDSPALSVAAQVRLQGAHVTVHDPQAIANARRRWPDLDYADSALEAMQGAHVVLHLTEWQEYRDLDPAVAGQVVATRRIIDGRNKLDVHRWTDAGWTLRALGRPTAVAHQA
ncbi:UDP-glucose dehydrogenase family protein [Angustibacter sp. McL0619]|uniref:UDP-glucose dehydrogenase family protein n=1 Tax=Angustibacter sp. McL0619 TaxID=3415676 RepID=UPI003CED8B32